MSTYVIRNSVKERLARGEVASSMTVRLTRSIEIARLAATAGFDSLYVDLEHSSLSLETTSQICIAALDVGIAERRTGKRGREGREISATRRARLR